MKKIAAVFLVLMAPNSMAIENDSMGPSEMGGKEPAKCGDNICETIEQGTCPSDCQKKTESTKSLKASKSSFNLTLTEIGLIIFSIALITILSLLGARLKNKKDKNSIPEDWLEEKHEQGYTVTQLEKYLKEKGYSTEQIESAKKRLDEY
ncbi:MAG: hypothetical protein ABEJ95_04825 [Candidatus Nanohalobium sp.]